MVKLLSACSSRRASSLQQRRRRPPRFRWLCESAPSMHRRALGVPYHQIKSSKDMLHALDEARRAPSTDPRLSSHLK